MEIFSIEIGKAPEEDQLMEWEQGNHLGFRGNIVGTNSEL